MRPVAATAVIAVAVIGTAASLYVAFAPERSGTLAFWALAAGPAILLGLASAGWAKHEGLLRGWAVPKWGDATRGVLGAVALFAAAWAFVHLLAPVGSKREVWLVSIYGQLGDPRALQEHAPELAVAIILAACAEELVWRGMVTRLLEERVGSRVAWVWAAGLYALAYVPTLYALRTGLGINPVLVILAAAGGLFWGAMSRALGRLFPAALAHALFDWAVVMMMPLWGPFR